MVKKIILVTLVFFHSVSWSNEIKIKSEVDQIVTSFMNEHDAPGFAVAILNKDEVIYKNAYGIQNIHTNEPVTTQTMFHMASVTKTIVATALMQLHEQGKMDIDQPIVKYLPYFRLVDDRYKLITTRHALSHISGMPDFDSNPWHDPDYDDEALERFVRDFVSHKFLIRDPEVKYEYCNTIFEVLGDVIAKVSGMTFEDYVHENVLVPLQMNSSSLLIRDIDKTALASPHRKNSDGKVYVSDIYPYNRAHGPSSTLTSNIEEMANYLKMYLNDGVFDDSRLLKKETIDDMWAPALGKFDNIGVGWHISEMSGLKVINHGGSDVGFKSFVLIIPEMGIAAVFLTNSITPPYRDFAQNLVDVIKKNQ